MIKRFDFNSLIFALFSVYSAHQFSIRCEIDTNDFSAGFQVLYVLRFKSAPYEFIVIADKIFPPSYVCPI